MRYPQAGKEEMCAMCCQPKAHINWNGHRADILFDDRTIRLRAPLREDTPKMTCRECFIKKKRTIPARSGERALQGKNSSLFFHHIPLRKIFPCFGQDFAGAGLNVIGGQREVSAVGAS